MIAQRFIYQTLKEIAAIDTAIGADNIWPNLSPPNVTGRHMTHSFAGPEGGVLAIPTGRGIAQVGVRWDITAWEPDYSQAALEPAMIAVMGALTGTDTRGRQFRFVDGARAYHIEALYGGPVQVPVEATPAGVWAPISERYLLTIRPLD